MKFVFGTKEALTNKIVEELSNVLQQKPTATLMLPTGSSPIGVYEGIINKYKSGEVSFKDITTINLDEYMGIDPETNEASFRTFMNKQLFDNVDIKKENTHLPEDIESYNKLLDGIEQFDFSLVGVGVNGHIAFNEPGVDFNIRTNEIELTKSTIEANFPNQVDYPTKAITMGIKDIYKKSSKLIIIAWGESKREALMKAKEGIIDPQWPITYFANHPNCVVYTDVDLK